MAKVVIINGYPGSGKDTFVNFCKKVYPNTHNFHTSDPAKQALTLLGWDGEKTPAARKMLADMVDFSYLYDAPFRYIQEEIAVVDKNCGKDAVVFVHCREYHNVVKFRKMFNAVTLFVDREEAKNAVFSNDADRRAGEGIYDYTVYNNGSLVTLAYSAEAFMLIITEGGYKEC